MTSPSDISIAIDEYGIRTTVAGDHIPEYTLLHRPVPAVAESAADWQELCQKTGYEPLRASLTIREMPVQPAQPPAKPTAASQSAARGIPEVEQDGNIFVGLINALGILTTAGLLVLLAWKLWG